LLKSLILKFVKSVKSRCDDAAAYYLVCVCACTHTKCYAAASLHRLFTLFTDFKVNDFNKEQTSSLKMIWMMNETCLSVF